MYKKIFICLFLFALTPLFVNAQEQEVTKTEEVVVVEEKNESIIQKVEHWFENNMNYTTITLLMTVESSFIPFPSEIVIPPAAYIASKPDSKLNIFLVVLFGTLGALIGALINYYLAMWLGRPIIYKFADSKIGRALLLNSEKIKKSEDYFNKHGKVSTFVGRLIPGIRQFISIPAGLARMNIFSFMLYTTIGAGIWNVVLALVGYLAQGQQDVIEEYSHELSYIILALVVVFAIYFVYKHFIKKK
ncbi:membrane protein DedA with SNARE-associated domain [Dysgonomonadaceae bacterium PH5-43]|nr:membrane protein DedA with SNARE-associated domain [Dysgonomonadaceae bacterium PH5-43]